MHAVVNAPPQPAGGGVWTELLVRPSVTVRRILVCVVGLQFFQEASGIEAIVLYSPLVFQRAGMASTKATLLATVVVGAVKTVSILVATLLADRLGRRPLLLASAGGVAVAMPRWRRRSGSRRCRAASRPRWRSWWRSLSGSARSCRRTARRSCLSDCGLVSMTFISLAGVVTMPGCFIVYACVATAVCVFVCLRVPETKDRGLEDMEVLFAK